MIEIRDDDYSEVIDELYKILSNLENMCNEDLLFCKDAIIERMYKALNILDGRDAEM